VEYWANFSGSYDAGLSRIKGLLNGCVLLNYIHVG